MAAFTPFLPAVKAGSVGQTVNIQATLSPGTVGQIISAGAFNGSLLVQAQGPAGQAAYLRMSIEASTTCAASITDTPIICQGVSSTSTVRLFANPSPTGTTTIAVAVTTTGSLVQVWVTPGQGGIS